MDKLKYNAKADDIYEYLRDCVAERILVPSSELKPVLGDPTKGYAFGSAKTSEKIAREISNMVYRKETGQSINITYLLCRKHLSEDFLQKL
jgi:hypothetical protein